jgi:hypothetical protein
MKADNPFKTKLFTHTLPVRDELWEAIEKRLPPEETERRFPIFWLVLFASTIASGALMFGFINKSNTFHKGPATPPAYTFPQDETVYQQKEESSSALTLHENNNQISSPAKDAGKQASTENANLNPSQNSVLNSTENSVSTSNSSYGKNSTKSSGIKSSSRKSDNRRHPSKANFNKSTELTTQALSNNIAEKPVNALHANTNYITSLLPLVSMEELNTTREFPLWKRRIKPDPSCYKFSGIAGNYYITADVFGGPGFSPRTFSYSDPELEPYFLARKTTENNQYAWSMGGRINLHLQSGMSVSLGILYDQAGDVFDYTDTLATKSTTQIDSFWNADGTFLYADTNRVLIFGTLIKKIHNTYRHLDVPLLIGYELPFGRSSLIINAGPVFNLAASYEGQILDPMLHPRNMSRGNTNELQAYKTSLGLSFYFGAGALFPVSDQLSVLVEPRYLYRIKPVTIKSYPLEEHRHYAGLNLGLRYLLD